MDFGRVWGVFVNEINFAKAINCWCREQWRCCLQSVRLKRARNNCKLFPFISKPVLWNNISTAERFCLQAQATGVNDIHNETCTLIKQQRLWASNQ